jgi:hypothetical protein
LRSTAARGAALAIAASVVGLAASAETVQTGLHGQFATDAGDGAKTRQLRMLNRTMRRLGCGEAVAAQSASCRQLMANVRSLSEPNASPLAPRLNPRPKPNPSAAAISRWGDPGSSYRTMCVRLCDGFYYPVSEASKPAGFPADEARCQSSCASPSKLFYATGADDDAERMVSLKGERYGDLPNAFRYRSEYDVTCSCKPLPWSAAGKAAFERRAVLATRTALETRVAAGADAAAKLLAESEIVLAETNPKPQARKVRRQVVMEETTVRPRFRLFGPQPSLLAPNERSSEPPRRRFFLFR